MQTISLRTVAHVDARKDVHGDFLNITDQLQDRIKFDVERKDCTCEAGTHTVVYARAKRDTFDVVLFDDDVVPESIEGTIDLCNDHFVGQVSYEVELVSIDTVAGTAKYEVK